jgi:hypothetical protein
VPEEKLKIVRFNGTSKGKLSKNSSPIFNENHDRYVSPVPRPNHKVQSRSANICRLITLFLLKETVALDGFLA